jgi:hypothetical protein
MIFSDYENIELFIKHKELCKKTRNRLTVETSA